MITVTVYGSVLEVQARVHFADKCWMDPLAPIPRCHFLNLITDFGIGIKARCTVGTCPQLFTTFYVKYPLFSSRVGLFACETVPSSMCSPTFGILPTSLATSSVVKIHYLQFLLVQIFLLFLSQVTSSTISPNSNELYTVLFARCNDFHRA